MIGCPIAGDNCPGTPDADGDGVGDVCDNCPSLANSDQADNDNDGIGDLCGVEPGRGDRDGDGMADLGDNCPDRANLDQADSDGDGFGNVCDNCVLVSNASQTDLNANGIGDACDPVTVQPLYPLADRVVAPGTVNFILLSDDAAQIRLTVALTPDVFNDPSPVAVVELSFTEDDDPEHRIPVELPWQEDTIGLQVAHYWGIEVTAPPADFRVPGSSVGIPFILRVDTEVEFDPLPVVCPTETDLPAASSAPLLRWTLPPGHRSVSGGFVRGTTGHVQSLHRPGLRCGRPDHPRGDPSTSRIE